MLNNHKRLPAELKDVATLQSGVTALEAKIDKCYTSEDYQKFQTDVETIVERYLDTDKAHEKLKNKINRQIKDYLDERGLRNKTFWIPTAIAGIATAASIVALFTS